MRCRKAVFPQLGCAGVPDLFQVWYVLPHYAYGENVLFVCLLCFLLWFFLLVPRPPPPPSFWHYLHYGIPSYFAALMEKGSPDIPIDPLKRTGRIFGGLLNDIKRRYPHYISDMRDALNFKCLMATIFIFFACISPCIAFGGLLGQCKLTTKTFFFKLSCCSYSGSQ